MIKFAEPEEKKILEVLVKNYVSHVVKNFLNEGIDFYIKKWKHFVDLAIKGYNNFYEEYINDLSKRNILEDIIDAVPDKRNEIIKILAPIDKKFSDSLENTNKFVINPEMKNRYPKKKYWWYWGLPKGIKFE